MSRILRVLSVALISSFLISPFTVFAEEELATTTPEVAISTETIEATSTPSILVSTTTEISLPIYIFADENGGILGMSQISKKLLVWSYATTTDGFVSGFMDPTSLPPESIGSTSDETSPLTPLGVLMVSWSFNGGLASGTPEEGEGVVASGTAIETQSYFPFGDTRASQQATTYGQQHGFLNQFTDTNTSLNYLNNRYESGGQGRFVSQDPVATDIGMMGKMSPYILAMSGNPAEIDQTALLSNPQMLNLYSYSVNNPINKSDPSGKFFQELALPLLTLGPPGWVAFGGAVIASTWLEIELIKHAPDYSNSSPDSGSSAKDKSTPPPSDSSGAKTKGAPKAPKEFIPPTNAPQAPPSPDSLPDGHTIRVMPPDPSRPNPMYPDGYWKQKNPENQWVDPSTGKPPSGTTPQVRSKTHVPLPPPSAKP